jgi:hypothetical protein
MRWIRRIGEVLEQVENGHQRTAQLLHLVRLKTADHASHLLLRDGLDLIDHDSRAQPQPIGRAWLKSKTQRSFEPQIAGDRTDDDAVEPMGEKILLDDDGRTRLSVRAWNDDLDDVPASHSSQTQPRRSATASSQSSVSRSLPLAAMAAACSASRASLSGERWSGTQTRTSRKPARLRARYSRARSAAFAFGSAKLLLRSC